MTTMTTDETKQLKIKKLNKKKCSKNVVKL
jgi:hypothetical protein